MKHFFSFLFLIVNIGNLQAQTLPVLPTKPKPVVQKTKVIKATSAQEKKIPPKFKMEPDLVTIVGGSFNMGSEDGGVDEIPVHKVMISSFKISKYEVTQEQWQAVMGNNPSEFKGNNLPVVNVSWDDVQEYIRLLNNQTGKSYRLPTEAEWEYAARGGNKSKGSIYSGNFSIENVGWFDSNSNSETHPIGQKQPNELGIYDMSGNVFEWCSDWYDEQFYTKSLITNPQGASNGAYRVVRGGSYESLPDQCRSAFRSLGVPENRTSYCGFRLASSL